MNNIIFAILIEKCEKRHSFVIQAFSSSFYFSKNLKSFKLLDKLEQEFYGLLQFTYMTGATVSNFSLEKFVASSTGCDGSFKLKHRKLYVFLCASDGRTYNAPIVNL